MNAAYPEAHFYSPPELNPAIMYGQTSLIPALKGFTPLSLRSMTDLTRVKRSLTFFTQEFPSSEIFPQFISAYLKDGATPPMGDFTLYAPLKKGFNRKSEEASDYTYVDGETGFMLGIRHSPSSKPLWLATLGFQTLDVSTSQPYINQLQAYDYSGLSTYLKKIQSEVLSAFRWEQLLVRLAIHWADSVGFEQVQIQTAYKNYYYPRSELRNRELGNIRSRFKLRYDSTAQRMGFKKQLDNDWKLELSEYNMDPAELIAQTQIN
jgi:hypothetical protein